MKSYNDILKTVENTSIKGESIKRLLHEPKFNEIWAKLSERYKGPEIEKGSVLAQMQPTKCTLSNSVQVILDIVKEQIKEKFTEEEQSKVSNLENAIRVVKKECDILLKEKNEDSIELYLVLLSFIISYSTRNHL